MPKGMYPRTSEHLKQMTEQARKAGEKRWVTGEKRYCVYCGKELPNEKWKYCSPECKAAYVKEEYRKANPAILRGGTSATTGAISELRVAIDLLVKGYNVFRSLSPSCPCDLAILKDGQLLKVEVRTSFISTSGKIYRTINKRDESKNIDIYAWVLPTKIVYEPELP